MLVETFKIKKEREKVTGRKAAQNIQELWDNYNTVTKGVTYM